jgi:ABC-type amino acid transport substrate-binding protein
MQSSQPSVFVNSSREGIARVLAGNYAYLMESSMLEYYVERDCRLTSIGTMLDSKGYGVGLPKGSPLRDHMSQAILRLQENTVLESLKEKWWKDRRVVTNADGQYMYDTVGNGYSCTGFTL